jgi:hypothetical protein
LDQDKRNRANTDVLPQQHKNSHAIKIFDGEHAMFKSFTSHS